MKIGQLLTASALYGVADMLVLGVGGFLLLPLYTRLLSPAEFGTYVIVKANAELLGYLLYFGLLSAVARLYFDYRERGRTREFMNSILMFFVTVVVAAGAIFMLWGDQLWRLMSPSTPSQPYLWYALGIAATTFVAGLGALWLRLENRVGPFVTLQIVAAVVLAATAYINLAVLKLGLPGLLIAFIVGYLPASAVLLYRLGNRLRPILSPADIGPALAYGSPFAISYIAYFFLNRFSVLALQRVETVDQIAIFGLAQQLSLVIAVVSQSFGKALQPAVFGASPDDAPDVLRRASRLFILLVFGASSVVVLFAREIIQVVAPHGYLAGLGVLLVLLVGSFVYALGLVSNTALEYHRRPRVSASVSLVGAAMSVALSLFLIPRYGLIGGAVATLGAYTATTMLGHVMAYRLTGQAYFGQMLVLTIVLSVLAGLATLPVWQSLGLVLAVIVKLTIAASTFASVVALYAAQSAAHLIRRQWRWHGRWLWRVKV